MGSSLDRAVWLFAGQGAQEVGMGRSLAEDFPAARDLFAEADRVLGFPISRLCFEGPEEELTRTENCQPALFVASLAALAAWRERVDPPQPAAAAGLSLGEFSALAAAGVFSFEDGLRLVRLRGRLMQEACDRVEGGMAAVIGLAPEAVEAVAAEAGVDVANRNAPGQIVLSGPKEAVARAAELARARGARRAVMLDVAGAYHSRWMEPAAKGLESALAGVEMRPPAFPVVCNVTAQPETDPETFRVSLVRQLVSPVLWEDSMRSCLKRNWGPYLEFGPGGVLAGLLRRIDRNAEAHTIGASREVAAAAEVFAAESGER